MKLIYSQLVVLFAIWRGDENFMSYTYHKEMDMLSHAGLIEHDNGLTFITDKGEKHILKILSLEV